MDTFISSLYKIYYDGPLFSEFGAARLGVVTRDSSGQMIGALAQRIPIPIFLATVGALAC